MLSSIMPFKSSKPSKIELVVKVSDDSNEHDIGAPRLADVNVTLMNNSSPVMLLVIPWNKSCRRPHDICVNLLRISMSRFMKDGKELS